MIETEQLQFAYPSGKPMQFPDLSVAQGKVLLLSGSSGSGKSTWLALMAALVKSQVGTVRVAGQDLSVLHGRSADAWRARHIGFLPQKLHLSPALNASQNLELAFWAAGLPVNAARMAQVLTALGVANLAHRLPAQLSGGQAQRVALARALLMQPSVILADEPTASLDDAAAQDAVQLLVRCAQEQNTTLVIATHDSRVAPILRGTGVATPVRMQLGQSPGGQLT
jgi:putative ABC transport system ATP-binding protein